MSKFQKATHDLVFGSARVVGHRERECCYVLPGGEITDDVGYALVIAQRMDEFMRLRAARVANVV